MCVCVCVRACACVHAHARVSATPKLSSVCALNLKSLMVLNCFLGMLCPRTSVSALLILFMGLPGYYGLKVQSSFRVVSGSTVAVQNANTYSEAQKERVGVVAGGGGGGGVLGDRFDNWFNAQSAMTVSEIVLLCVGR